jgi:hypothetical protein
VGDCSPESDGIYPSLWRSVTGISSRPTSCEHSCRISTGVSQGGLFCASRTGQPLSDLGTVPPHWHKYKIPRGTTVTQYIANLVARLEQLERIVSSEENAKGVWLGGLFQPEAYITATRQTIAHKHGWSLEQLVLSLDIEETDGVESFMVEGESTCTGENMDVY